MRVRLTFEKSRIVSMRTWLPLVILALAAAPQAAIAQNNMPRSFSCYVFQNEPPSKLVAAAFAQPYGRAIAAEFSAALAESADPDCLKTKRFTKEQFPDRALAMLQKRGAYMLDRTDLMTDQVRFKSYLRARIGADGMTEVERLRNDPLVRAYLAVDEPARLAYIAVAIVEQIQRYANSSLSLAFGVEGQGTGE